jgi:hypothetical protein
MNAAPRAVWLLVALVLTTFGAERWRVQYFHDEEKSRLLFSSIEFTSKERGVAAGSLVESRKRKSRPASLVTADSGRTWSPVPIKEHCLSLFFLDERNGWMVTTGGLWKTAEAGRSWTKISRLKYAFRVHFVDENRGWAIGARKLFVETSDGGRNWTKVAGMDQVKTKEDFTAFQCIAFADKRNGLVAGASVPPRRGLEGFQRFPDWMDPESAERNRQWPSMTIFLETRDGGKSWTPSQTSMFGRVTRIRLTPGGRGVGLVEFRDSFEWPSEVFQIDWKSGRSSRIFRSKEHAVTDLLLFPEGRAYLAAIESPGRLRRSPVPGKLVILQSDNLEDWTPMDVDYRAVAQRATFAAADAEHIWLATDAGMILALERGGR